jgi:hypothetical protein
VSLSIHEVPAVDVDLVAVEDGAAVVLFAYDADNASSWLTKVRVSDGAVLARRNLDFNEHPVSAVDPISVPGASNQAEIDARDEDSVCEVVAGPAIGHVARLLWWLRRWF